MKIKLFNTDINIRDYYCDLNDEGYHNIESPYINLYIQMKGCNASCEFCEYKNSANYFNKEKLRLILDYLGDNIEMVYIPNGKNLIYYHSSGCYELPFNEFFWKPTALNIVYYSESNNIYGLNMICVNGNDNNNRGSGYYRTNVDYYYGYLLNFAPKSNETITINLKNMIWGLKLKAKKAEGAYYDELIVKINSNSNDSKIFHMKIDNSNEITEFVIPKILLGGCAENYYKDPSYEYFVDFSVGTEKNPFEIINGKLGIKQNVMKVIEFNAISNNVNNGITITTDDSEMSEEITNL